MAQPAPNFFRDPVEYFRIVWGGFITPTFLILTHVLTVPILGNRKLHHTVISYVSAMCNPIATSTMGIGNLFCIFLLFRRISADLDSTLESKLGKHLKIRVDQTRQPFSWFVKRKFLVELMPFLFSAGSKQTDLSALNENAELERLVDCLRPLFNLVHRWHYACALYDKAIVVRFDLDRSHQINWEEMWNKSRKSAKDRRPYPYLFSNQRIDMARDAFPKSDVGKKFWTFLHWDIATEYPIETYYELARRNGDQFLSSTKGGNKYDIAVSCVQAFVSSMYAFRNGFPDMNSPDLLLAVFSIHSIINAVHHFLYITTTGHRVLVLESPLDVNYDLIAKCTRHQNEPTIRSSKSFRFRAPWRHFEEMHENIKDPVPLSLVLRTTEKGLVTACIRKVDAKSSHEDREMGYGLPAGEFRATEAPPLTVTALCTRAKHTIGVVQLALYAALITINTHRTGGMPKYTKLGKWALVWLCLGSFSSICLMYSTSLMEFVDRLEETRRKEKDGHAKYGKFGLGFALVVIMLVCLTYPGLIFKCIFMSSTKMPGRSLYEDGYCDVAVGLSHQPTSSMLWAHGF
ncbi:hypothetical protein HDU81_003972 [Chytriomyces hyalinus]|nr:hypothetical protein HDU81_003972 [Chytriomyces hyalinus]